jgi:ABC-2 type transport system ATP-binding protein
MTELSMALEVSGLGKRYGRSWGLQDCSFRLPQGKVAALVGPNGAGKSTLLRIAAGMTRPTVGHISVLGHSPQDQSKELLPHIAYFDQERPLYSSFRVREMLHFGRGLNPGWDQTRALGYLEDMGIALESRVGKLSIGQQTEVALTLCLAKRPDFLLLDEPGAALDPLARQRLMQVLLGSVVDDGSTVLLSSHVLSDLESICDFIIILSASRVQVADDLDHVLATHHLLVGDRQATPDLGQGGIVISRFLTGRQSQWLVRSEQSFADSSWEVVEPTLQEVVLGYLQGGEDRLHIGRKGESDIGTILGEQGEGGRSE